MQSVELRELTASEELTLEQEYAMQRELPLSTWSQTHSPDHGALRISIESWQEDEDSACTSRAIYFVVYTVLFCFMLLELTFIILARPLEPIPSEVELTNGDIKALPMIGDVNLFFKNPRDDPEFEVECEVMIAGPCSTPHPLLLDEQNKSNLHTHSLPPPNSSPCRSRLSRSTACTRNTCPAPFLRMRQARHKERVFRSPNRLGQRAEHRVIHESWL